MKKFLLFLLICAMLLTLIACNNETPPATDGAGDTAGNEQGGTENGGEGDVLDAKKLLSLSPDNGIKTMSFDYAIRYYGHGKDVSFKRTFDGDNFSEERDGCYYDYIDGWYYESSPASTFRAEIPREEVKQYYGEELPAMPDLFALDEAQLEGVPVLDIGGVYLFDLHLSLPLMHEDIKCNDSEALVSTDISARFDKSYRLCGFTCAHTVKMQSGDTYEVSLIVDVTARGEEASVSASASMESYKKLLKEDAAALVAALPHLCVDDYHMRETLVATKEMGTVLADQRLEVIDSGDNYFYHYSAEPLSASTYLHYFYSDGTVYQTYYDHNASSRYVNVRFPMAKEEFEEALSLGGTPKAGDDFTDMISLSFSDTLKGVAVYELADGGFTLSYTTDTATLFDNADFGGALSETADVSMKYEKSADKMTVSIVFSFAYNQGGERGTARAVMDFLFEGFEGDVALTLPDPGGYGVLGN